MFMTSPQYPVTYNFRSGSIQDAGTCERIGLELMRIAARILRSVSFVGFSWASRLFRVLFPGHQPIKTVLQDDAIFEFPYGDAYWGRLLCNRELYTQEIDNFLRAIKHVDYDFIDCGANYGYMSVIASSKAYGSKRAIAIEADPHTFELLQTNADHNAKRFDILNKAVFSKGGDIAEIYGTKHEARSILPDGSSGSGNKVETLALDQLLTSWLGKSADKAVIIKLDVEGVEIDAMKGAVKLLERDCLMIFEDHGSDKTHAVTRYFMDELGMQVFASTQSGCEEITDMEYLDHYKTNSRLGYDFIATRSDFWLKAIAKVRY